MWARLDEGQRRRLGAQRWRDRLTSLWAPVAGLVLAFIPYLIAIEAWTCSHLWLQPLMKGIALAALLAMAALGGARLALPGFAARRKLRRAAAELILEIEEALSRRPARVDEPARLALIEASVAVEAAAASGDARLLSQRAAELSALSGKHLAGRKGSALDFVGGFGKALLVALLIRAVVIEPFKIPSGSMIPTLQIGDQIFVNKFLYGVRIPWTNWVPFVLVREPARGDVIVFNNPVNTDLDFVKRVVGIPGDRIEVVDKVIHVNGAPQPIELLDDGHVSMDQDQHTGEWFPQPATLFRERLGEQAHLALRDRGDPGRDPSPRGPFEVPAGHVFVMGDNRDKSSDGRAGFGRPELGPQYVPFGHIKGKAMVIWLSLSHGGIGHQLFGGTGLRTDRLFQPVSLCAGAR